jgi:hypothetical protein
METRQVLRAQAIMIMENQSSNPAYDKRIIPLCELKVKGFDNPCIVYGTPGEFERYKGACEMVMETGWIAYMAQQYQLLHEDKLLSLSKSIPCKDNHLVRMYHDTEYS